jgi:integrase
MIEAAHAGLPGIRLHDLRHTGGRSRCRRVSIRRFVQERLGHANVSITLDVYPHVSESLHGDAASSIAKLIFGPVSTLLAGTGADGDE